MELRGALRVSLFLLFGLILVSGFFAPVTSQGAKQWTVASTGPADYNTIQKAVNVASEGDTILVGNGNYNATLINKSIKLVGEDQGPKVNYLVRIQSLEIAASGVEVHSAYSPQITIDNGINDLTFDRVGGSFTFQQSERVKISTGAGQIQAGNATTMSVTDFDGPISGTFHDLTLTDSTSSVNLHGSKVSISGGQVSGNTEGTDFHISRTVGQFVHSGAGFEFRDSLAVSLQITGDNATVTGNTLDNGLSLNGKKAVIEGNTISGAIVVQGDNDTFAGNTANQFSLGVLGSNATVTDNLLTNKFGATKQPPSSSSTGYDVSIQGSSDRIEGNRLNALHGLDLQTCDSNVTNNFVNRTYLPRANYSVWAAGEQQNNIAGLKIDGHCSVTGRGNMITLNKVSGFFQGMLVSADNNTAAVNEVDSNRTNIRVTGNTNQFYHNNFLGNASAIDDGKNNQWYTVSRGFGSGNYWQTWNAQAIDSGTILDKTFALDGTGNTPIDRYPLAKPVPLLKEMTVVVPDLPAPALWTVLTATLAAVSILSLFRRAGLRRLNGGSTR